MFTGIVEELGRIADVHWHDDESAVLTIEGPGVTADARHGDSIAVNGVCLTVVDLVPGGFTTDVMRETLRRTSLGTLDAGAQVNLERALSASARLGGHVMQGHVDGTGVVLSREPSQHWELMRISLPHELTRYVVEKGSIAVNGVSLTVAAVSKAEDAWFEVSLIPTTLASTTMGHSAPGTIVNIEVDVLAKYVEGLLDWRSDDAR